MAKDLDEQVEAFRTRPLDTGPYTFLAADALVLKVRENGRVVGVHTRVATGVNAEGYREILGVAVSSAADTAGWLVFFRDLVARGLSGVALVTSDAPGPVWERLVDELPDDPNALVFPHRRGGLLPIEEYRREFDKACAQVGIEGLVPHGLRHTTASLAISASANVKVVQRMLGHATAVMTLDRYGHLLDDDLSGVAAALGAAIDSVAVSLRYAESQSTGGAENISAAS